MQGNTNGQITCVGLGMTLGAHITPLGRDHIKQADVVFTGVSNHLIELWVQEMNTDVRSLQPLYRQGKDRRETYRQMVDVMMKEVRLGKRVVGAFYGHPGIFAWSGHNVIKEAKIEGFAAQMVPGISAEDCLYADMGIDPGTHGCQHYEASHIMFNQINIETSAYLVLWQIGIAGDQTASKFSTGREHRKLLSQILMERYPTVHRVAVYECPTIAIEQPRIDWVALNALASCDVSQHSTLVIPPSKKPNKNSVILERLKLLS